MRKLSISAIETFADCPRKYKFQYIDRKYRPQNEHFIFGTLGHRICEYIADDLDDDTIMLNVDMFLESTAVLKALQKLKITDLKSLVTDYILTLRNFLKDFKIVGTEIKLTDEHNVGVIDLVAIKDNSLYIIDYKFTNYAKTEDDIADNLQLYMYAKLIDKMPGIEDIIIENDIRSVFLGYFSLSKKEKRQPRMLRSGKLSKAKDDAVTYDTFIEALEEHKLDITDYDDHLETLKEKSSVEFVYERLHNSTLEEKIKDIESWTKLITYATEHNLFPGRDKWTCSKCPIQKECKNHIGGK